MSLIKKFCNFLKRILSYFKKSSTEKEFSMNEEEELLREHASEESVDVEILSAENEYKPITRERTLLTKLYILEQEIDVFEHEFPKEYQSFKERIYRLRETYNLRLNEISEEMNNVFHVKVDPEFDSNIIGEVLTLEMDIEIFIGKDLKFSIISKRLERLITKLNILYNVSIFHSKETEKEKVISRLGDALDSATEIAREFKECKNILSDRQLKERIVSLISYADYQIFKAFIRNANEAPDKLIKKLVTMVEFKEFDYASVFKAFIKDELTDLGGLLTLITQDNYCRVLRKNLQKLLTEITYSENAENQVLDIDFWNKFLEFESCLFEMLEISGVEKEKIKVSLIVRMSISVVESEVLVLPITNTCLSLASLYSMTQDTKILILIKLIKNLSNDLTYKEVYFLLLLFDLIGVIQNTPNELIRHIEKYLKKYPYDAKTIMEKKERVINSLDKEYVVAFNLSDYEKEIITTLESLNIDFKVVDNQLLINSFYFKGLKNVFDSLQYNTKNITI